MLVFIDNSTWYHWFVDTGNDDWGLWSGWSSCSTCDEGSQVRFRKCKAPFASNALCSGTFVEERSCDNAPCSSTVTSPSLSDAICKKFLCRSSKEPSD